MKVGEYTNVEDVINDLELFTLFTNEDIGKKWVSVFGVSNSAKPMSSSSFFKDDPLTPDVNDNGEVTCHNCPDGREKGADEWYVLFTNEVLVSPFQDGHYIYVVIPGGGSGDKYWLPTIVIADLENPKDFNKWLTP